MTTAGIRRPFLLYLALQLLALVLLIMYLRWIGSHTWSDLLASGNQFRILLLVAIGTTAAFIGLKLYSVGTAGPVLAHTGAIRPIHVDADEEVLPLVDPVQESLRRLDAMTGLHTLKSEVRSLVARIQVEQRRTEIGLNVTAMSQHMIFSGAPGVGKTEVARILGDIYKALKVVRKGHLVEVDRAALVAGYVGQTAIKTLEKCKEALDGILFIDEAYTLVSDAAGGHGFGQEAIDTLLKFMEDNRSRIVVIAAGYPTQMNQFINANPGLASRFTKKLHFDNYVPDELLDIFSHMATSQHFVLPESYRSMLHPWLAKHIDQANWANAREMRTLLDRIREEQALRIAQHPQSSLTEISEEDLRAAISRLIP